MFSIGVVEDEISNVGGLLNDPTPLPAVKGDGIFVHISFFVPLDVSSDITIADPPYCPPFPTTTHFSKVSFHAAPLATD